MPRWARAWNRGQRNKGGADGATTIIVRGDRLVVPVDYDLDKDRPEMAVRSAGCSTNDGDVVIIGTSSDVQRAEEGALAAPSDISGM